MSGSITATGGATAPGAASGTAAAAAGPPANALTSLSNNFNNFLNLLLTQLKNQDPSSPMDANTFTTELVQFSGVEQQITTNNSLTQLIQATQGTEVIQATGVVGKDVTATSPKIPLQNGAGSLSFTTAAAEPVAIKITDAAGLDVRDASLSSRAGANTWRWDGTDNNGNQLPDGAYTATVVGSQDGGSAKAIPFTVAGKATGVLNSNGAVSLQLGAVSVDFSKVLSVGTN